MSALAEMPRYRCHKAVQALKIANCGYTDDGRYLIDPADDGFAPFEVGQEWAVKHKPQPGGYFVVYEDGYTSFSPAAAFEAGYTPLRPRPLPPPEVLERIARVCHETNRAYCLAVGDASQPAWEDAPQWQRDSAKNGVAHAIAYPDTTPTESHANWCAQKRAEGWEYGDVKDPEAKRHPCLLPYDQLPPLQRVKDTLFLGTVRALAPPA